LDSRAEDGLVVGGELVDDVSAELGVAWVGGITSGSHDALPAVVAVPAVALPAAMARVTPEAAVARTVPAIRVTVAGRACAKRMKRPTCAARCCCECPYSTQRHSGRYPPPTRSAVLITAR